MRAASRTVLRSLSRPLKVSTPSSPDSIGSNPPRFTVGQLVTVRYDPQNVSNARLAGRFRLWFVPMPLGGLGVLFLGVGIAWALFLGPDPT